MEDNELAANLQFFAHEMLVWVGFGTLVGLFAKAIMPGRDPGGPVTTVLMGITGSVIGGGALALIWRGHHVTPISPLGFLVATIGALVLLVFFRLFGGRTYLQRHAQDWYEPPVKTRPHYARRRRLARYEWDE